MFDAYWKDDLDISNEEILIQILEQCKIDKDILGIKNLVWIDKCCYLKYSNPPSKATANDGFI